MVNNVFEYLYIGELSSMKVVHVKVPESMTERDIKIAAAIEALLKGAASAGKAAEIAELPIQEFLYELKKRGVQAYSYTDEEALEELKL
jgi:predicted HTH domain antitoxin